MPKLLVTQYDSKTLEAIGGLVQAGLTYGEQLKLARAHKHDMEARKRLVHLETKILMAAEKLHRVARPRRVTGK